MNTLFCISYSYYHVFILILNKTAGFPKLLTRRYEKSQYQELIKTLQRANDTNIISTVLADVIGLVLTK